MNSKVILISFQILCHAVTTKMLHYPGEDGCSVTNEPLSCRVDAQCTNVVSIALESLRKLNDVCGSGINYGYMILGYVYMTYKDFDRFGNNPGRIPYTSDAEVMDFIIELNLSENSYNNVPLLTIMQRLKKLIINYNQLRQAKLYNDFELVSLTDLDLSHNVISGFDIDNNMFVYRNLLYLNISYNYLITIPDFIFESFTRLESLDLSHNYIDTLGVMTFEGIKHLRYLNLSNNRISELNQSLLRFSELEELHLDNNKITHIKFQDFERLTKLNKLCLQSNLITSIEVNALHNMLQIKTLDLRHNSIEFLQKDMFEPLEKLHAIYLSWNKLRAISNEMFKHNNITEISLEQNSLEGSLERGTFIGLKMVLQLDLSKQKLTNIEDYAFFGLEQLTTLLLNDNNLKHISKKSFNTLRNLNELNLADNQLVEVNFEKEELISLRFLTLSNNIINHLNSDDLNGLYYLEFLDLSKNNITNLSTGLFKDLNKLINFKIFNNPLTGSIENNAFAGLNALPNLDISQTSITVLKNGSFSDLNVLNDLNISRSRINEIQFNAFIETSTIESIDLSFNEIVYLNINNTNLKNLKTLILNNNHLLSITDNSLQSLYSLLKLDISHNNIEFIQSEVFNDPQDLRYLDISYNNKFKFDIFLIKNLQNLRDLLLSGLQTEIVFNKTELNNLFQVDISQNNINNVTSLQLFNIYTIKALCLRKNNITTLEVGSFDGLKDLQVLDLSYNKILFIQPGIFKDSSYLDFLNISHNDISAVSYGVFLGLTHLEKLDISFNKINNLKNERFYELSSLSTLIADNNVIESINPEDFLGTNLNLLSIGGNPLSCESLVNFKKSGQSFIIVAIKYDHTSENIEGITCNQQISNFGSKSNNNTTFRENSEQILLEIKNILVNSSIAQYHSENTLEHIKNIFNISPYNTLSFANNDSIKIDITERMLRNLTKLFEFSEKKTSDIVTENVNKTNFILEKILKVLNSTNTTPYVAVHDTNDPKENLTQGNILKYINNIELKSKINDGKIQKLELLVEKLNSSMYLDVNYTKTVPRQEKLETQKDNVESHNNGSTLFTEICVTLILIIVVCYVLFKFYQSKVYYPTRRSMSTRQITESLESSNL